MGDHPHREPREWEKERDESRTQATDMVRALSDGNGFGVVCAWVRVGAWAQRGAHMARG